MKKKILFFITSAVLTLSSLITGHAASGTVSQEPAEGFSFKLMFRCFAESPAAIAGAAVFAVAVLILLIFGKKICRKLENSKSVSLVNAFIVFFCGFGIACFAVAVATDGETWSNLMHVNNESEMFYTQFEDYLVNLRNAGSQKFYKSAETNSPFSLLVFFLLAQFVPSKYIYSEAITANIPMLRNQTFMYLYLILVMVTIFCMYRMNRQVLRHNKLNLRDELVSFLLIVSYPTMYCIEQGNFIGLSLVGAMFFVLFHDDEKRYLREISCVLLAISAALNPAFLIFALILLKDKSKKSIIGFSKTVGYFLALFILPAFFTGFGNLLTFVKSFVSVTSDGYQAGNMSIANLLHFFGLSNTVVIYAVVILTNVIAALAMFMLPKMWQKTAAGAYIYLNIFAISSPIALIIIFIPLCFLLAEEEHRAIDWAYMITFALLVTPFPEWFRSDSVNFSMFLASFGIEGVRNANDLISLAATQFVLILLFYQIVVKMSNNKKKISGSVKQ